MSQTPSPGRIVLYTLGEADAMQINKRRADFEATLSAAHAAGEQLATGYQGHYGNVARAGDAYPAVVTRVWSGNQINASVLLDGNDTFWVTSRSEGENPGNWAWPPHA